MAKDGTMRGGARPNTGPKRKSVKRKMLEGQMETSTLLPEPAELEAADVPPVREFMKAKQKNGKDLGAEEIYRSTYIWLRKRGCEKLVSTQLVEQYAMSVARWIQCESAISEYGFLAKHPTTGNAMQSPYVAMSQNYMKQVNQLWFQIFQIVKENGSGDTGGANPQDEIMEKLLKARRN